ncbi:MAG: TraB/GumN family protein [Rhizomicrobium sp.]
MKSDRGGLAAEFWTKNARPRWGLLLAVCLGVAALFAPAEAGPLIHAHPALWHVQGPGGDAYLFGSIHLLPKGTAWHTAEVDAAIRRADVFVFEVAVGTKVQAKIRGLIATEGMLPPDRSLRALLPPSARPNFDAAVAKAHLSPDVVDHERPWLVALQMLVAESAERHYSANAGVDHQVMAIAMRRHKPMRYFETIGQQFQLLAGSSEKVQLKEFEADLKDFKNDDDELEPLVEAWSAGQEDKLARIMNSDLMDEPDARKTLLTDRNRRWTERIEVMLKKKKTFFITVGAGHLAGPDGVPAMLRRAGYKVDGP